ncbi:MAG: hypothetical protein HY299_09810 [Verrucomicrobia bacterium]|nr:hypothetical protein [Verrucomicrobiota bacterium]
MKIHRSPDPAEGGKSEKPTEKPKTESAKFAKKADRNIGLEEKVARLEDENHGLKKRSGDQEKILNEARKIPSQVTPKKSLLDDLMEWAGFGEGA